MFSDSGAGTAGGTGLMIFREFYNAHQDLAVSTLVHKHPSMFSMALLVLFLCFLCIGIQLHFIELSFAHLQNTDQLPDSLGCWKDYMK